MAYMLYVIGQCQVIRVLKLLKLTTWDKQYKANQNRENTMSIENTSRMGKNNTKLMKNT